MITKFELFKSVNIGEPEIGDYVICEEIGIDQVSNFINNNIGKTGVRFILMVRLVH